MCHIQDGYNLQLNEGREFNGSSGKCSRKWRTRAAAPWSLNGSKSVVEVALIDQISTASNTGGCCISVLIAMAGNRVSMTSRTGLRHTCTRACAPLCTASAPLFSSLPLFFRDEPVALAHMAAQGLWLLFTVTLHRTSCQPDWYW